MSMIKLLTMSYMSIRRSEDQVDTEQVLWVVIDLKVSLGLQHSAGMFL